MSQIAMCIGERVGLMDTRFSESVEDKAMFPSDDLGVSHMAWSWHSLTRGCATQALITPMLMPDVQYSFTNWNDGQNVFKIDVFPYL